MGRGTWLSRIPIWNLVKLKVKRFTQLDDVSISSPGNDHVVYWDAGAGKFKAKAAPGGASGEGHITILPPSYSNIVQGTWSFDLAANTWTYGRFTNQTEDDGDCLLYKIYLDAGTYTLCFYTLTAVSRGIVDFWIDDDEVASVDCYSNPTVYNVRKTQTGIIIGSSGLKTLALIVDGKNPLASNHMASIIYIAIWRTA